MGGVDVLQPSARRMPSDGAVDGLEGERQQALSLVGSDHCQASSHVVNVCRGVSVIGLQHTQEPLRED